MTAGSCKTASSTSTLSSARSCEWFHTHVIYPTECMTLLLLFPEHKRAKGVQGVCKYRPEDPFTLVERQPVVSPEGRFACWRAPCRQLGATYQLEWTW